ncbi:MAG: molybdopterin molybdotransferase MoeA [Phycisphaerales bacterium]
MPFSTPSDALDALLTRVRPLARIERIPIGACSGRILAHPLTTDRDSPAADVSAMDGYAIGPLDCRAGPLPISATGRIGEPPPPLTPGTAVRIVTGGGVPAGSFAVIRREDVAEHGDHIVLSEQAARSGPGQNIRRCAENAPAGTLAAPPGRVITPALAGALATFGVGSVPVFARLRVGILRTGDELLPIDSSPSPFQVRDSSGIVLRALVEARPWAAVEAVSHSGDDLEPTRAALGSLIERCDAIMVTGGVSMGDRDHVPAAIRDLGGQTVFHKLPQRPGRPILAAVLPDGRPIFGLPGNPLSTLITARRFAIPTFEALAGLREGGALPFPATLAAPSTHPLDLYWFRLFTRSAAGGLHLLDPTGSGDVPASARSDGFVEIPPGATGCGPFSAFLW